MADRCTLHDMPPAMTIINGTVLGVEGATAVSVTDGRIEAVGAGVRTSTSGVTWWTPAAA